MLGGGKNMKKRLEKFWENSRNLSEKTGLLYILEVLNRCTKFGRSCGFGTLV